MYQQEHECTSNSLLVLHDYEDFISSVHEVDSRVLYVYTVALIQARQKSCNSLSCL